MKRTTEKYIENLRQHAAELGKEAKIVRKHLQWIEERAAAMERNARVLEEQEKKAQKRMLPR